MKALPDNSVGNIVTDPPYLIAFMGKKWDVAPEEDADEESISTEDIHANEAFHLLWLREALRILKPGGIIKVFAATRTMHRLAMAMQNVGFEALGLEAWVYGSGFPKSLNVSKAVEGHMLKGRSDSTVTGDGSRDREGLHWSEFPKSRTESDKWEPDTKEAQQFSGFGTALKPAWEPFVCGRKPL